MTGPRRVLIERLVSDLPPVRERPRPALALALWWSATWLWTIVATVATAPLRPGSLEALLETPRFAAELALGLAAGLAVAALAVASMIPGRIRRRHLWLAIGASAVWAGIYAIGFWWPTVEPSMLGKRPHCEFEVVVLALPPFLAGLLGRRWYPTRPGVSGALLGLAAALPSALFMQLACMYEPAHILLHHLLPAVAVAGAGAIAGSGLLRR